MDYPVILNLNFRSIFQEFIVSNIRPVIAFDNFRELNLYLVDYTMMLRAPVPFVLATCSGKKITYSAIKGTSRFTNYNASFDSQEICSFSKFYEGYNNGRDLCLRINKPIFANKLKPFTFTVHMGV